MLNEQLEYVSPEDYLQLEAQSPARHEYVAGRVYAMTGATLRHNILAGNLYAALRAHLKASPCRVFIEGVKLNVARDNAYYYPDVMVSCDPRLQTIANDAMVIDQPTVLIEVLSDSTEGVDRREKFFAYRKLASLKEYLLIAQNQQEIELFRRQGDVGWERCVFSAGDELVVSSLDFRCPLAEVYEGSGL
jgi:Uma2 family endonuclease